MHKSILLILVLFSLCSCRNYESNIYTQNENEAINDILLEMTEFEEMKKSNNWPNEKRELYISTTLDTATAWMSEPSGFVVSFGGTDLSKEQIEKNKKIYEEDLTSFNQEEKLFRKLKNGKIKQRDLNYTFKNDQLNVQNISAEKTKTFDREKNDFGYLTVSRIIFNQDFTKGYLHYTFFCGIGCAWDNNIEIKKVDGKWKITRYFSGGIA